LKSSYPNAKQLNAEIESVYSKYNEAIKGLIHSGQISSMSAVEIKDYITRVKTDGGTTSFNESFADYASRCKAERTQEMYRSTLMAINKYTKDQVLQFDDITFAWLTKFDEHLAQNGCSTNTRSIHFRNMRTVFNRAIDEEVIGQSLYPFRKFKIKSARKDKESLSIDEIASLRALPLENDILCMARDLFMLSFYLCGINLVDLFQLKELHNGKIRFVRQKTAGKNEESVIVKVQPEAMDIINRYRGKEYLLRFAEHYQDYNNFGRLVRSRLRAVAILANCPGMTYYWARYSWATIADSIGIAEKEISKGLGHVDTSLAGRVYISYDWGKVDVANRKVIDYMLDHTKPSE
ncbi:MAG: site-specific integrase, partial [Alistipes sp.]